MSYFHPLDWLNWSFNRLQLFLYETLTVPVSPEAGFRNRDISEVTKSHPKGDDDIKFSID